VVAAAVAWTTGSTAVAPEPWAAAGSWTWMEELHSSFLQDSAALELADAFELAADNYSLLTSFRSVAGKQEQEQNREQVVERQEPGMQTGQTLQRDQRTSFFNCYTVRSGLDRLSSALFMSVTQVLQYVLVVYSRQT